ncbi:MAG: efflux RND transporter periplasmic adaptor subunit [Gemmatimonadota bacterium]|nr:efflux RND transporter periplasmic adaptor subunit [Gemmatimonadota bacterium]
MKTRSVMVLAAAFVGCGGEASPAGGAAGGGGGAPVFPVDVAVARTDTVIETIRATGAIEAVQAIELRPEVEGRIVEILAREGTEVVEGTGLFKIDDSQLKAQVARLEAERDLATQALRRTSELIERNASSAADLEQAEANARSAEAQLELQQIRLERTVVRAPFSGVTGVRLVSLGDYVTSATRLTTLQTVDPQRAGFTVAERYAERLRLGQAVTFAVAALPDRQFTGTVDFVDPRVELPARTITVKARVRNPTRVLKPGMFVDVSLVSEVRPQAVVVPEDAVLPVSGADYVWVISDDAATRREVTLGVRIPGFVEVLNGVTAGEQVVVGGLERLFEGAQVRANVVERGE